MLLSKSVMVRWNGSTRTWYESRGYKWTKQNEFFECKFEDVQKESTAKVLVKCDYCGCEFEKQYRNYLREKIDIEKDCCSDSMCKSRKSQDSIMNKYGVINCMQLEDYKDNLRKKYQTSFEEVRELCNTKGLILISKSNEYQNDRSRLLVICEKHIENGVFDTSFANIKKSKHSCTLCADEYTTSLKRMDGNVVYQTFIDKGLEPQFNPTDYNNNVQLLPYLCPKHKDKGIQYRSYAALQASEGCYYCRNERIGDKLRLDEEFVFNQMIKRGLIPTENAKYNNKDEQIPYYCKNHSNHIQYVRFGVLDRTQQPCLYCRIEESMTYLNRRLRSYLSKWREDSEKDCDYKCVLSGNSDYEIHHLIDFNDIIKEALTNLKLDISSHGNEYTADEFVSIKDEVLSLHDKYPLGVCISKDLHIVFHQIFGKDNNNIEEFNIFTNMYKKGELNKMIDSLKQAV